MAEQGLLVRDIQEGVRHSGVSYVNFRRTNQALRSIRCPGLKTAYEQEIDERIEISRHRLSADAESGRQTGSVQHLALTVRQHLPESVHGFRGQARAKRRQITL